MNASKLASVIVLAFGLSMAAHAADQSTVKADHEKMKADKVAVDNSCKPDLEAAIAAKVPGCSEGEVVGKGLLKCLHAFKKSNKDYKFSEGCKSAMKTAHADRKQLKEDKK